jgi:hypothetical protein
LALTKPDSAGAGKGNCERPGPVRRPLTPPYLSRGLLLRAQPGTEAQASPRPPRSAREAPILDLGCGELSYLYLSFLVYTFRIIIN